MGDSVDVVEVTPRRSPASASTSFAAARPQIAEALIWVAIWVCGAAGLILGAYAALRDEPHLLIPAIITTAVGVVGLGQRLRSRPRPLALLLVASVALVVVVPVVDTAGHVVIVPALILASSVGALSLSRSVSIWYAGWCWLLVSVSLHWILPGADVAGYALATVFLGLVVAAGWRFVGLAGDLLARQEESHRLLLEGSPVAILEVDLTELAARLGRLRDAGVRNLEHHLSLHPAVMGALVSAIRIGVANDAALEMIGARSTDELRDRFSSAPQAEHQLEAYRALILAIWEHRTHLAIDLSGVTLAGEPYDAVLHCSVPVLRAEPDLAHVIVTISDVAPRKAVEDRLTELLAANRRLLESEHALVLSSRALLTGRGEDALESALVSLREASGSDIAYLAMNVEDPDLGPAFRVVRSVTGPDAGVDEWVGTTHPWSKYPVAAETLREGRPFHHIATERPGAGWNRSILSVPVFVEERWVACVGFVDVAEKRVWDEQDTRMLEVAAPMLGAFWEREKTRERLEELVRSKDRFVASVSHELRTPLAAVLGFAEELRANLSGFEGGELTEMLELISTQSREMANMVEDLLVSARLDTGISIRPETAYLRAQAETVLAGLGNVPHREIHVLGDRGMVWADPTRTRQIIRNLITNAVRYGGDRVLIEASEGEESTVLTVIDDGPGLDEEQWELIFEPYHRAHESKTQPASIGLGLTVSRQLARMMGGDLSYERDHRGSVLTLVLPARRRDMAGTDIMSAELLTARSGN